VLERSVELLDRGRNFVTSQTALCSRWKSWRSFWSSGWSLVDDRRRSWFGCRWRFLNCGHVYDRTSRAWSVLPSSRSTSHRLVQIYLTLICWYLTYWKLRCICGTGSRCFDWSIKCKRRNCFSSLELKLLLALLYVFQIISYDSTCVSSNSNSASINTELDCSHILSFGQCNLLIRRLNLWAVLVNVNLFYFFSHSDIIEMDLMIISAGCEKQVINLGEGNSSAWPTLMRRKHKLLCALTRISRREDILCIPNYNLTIWICWCQNVSLHDWEFNLSDFVLLARVHMPQHNGWHPYFLRLV